MTADLHSLAAAYALDALDHDERLAFEAHLAECAECAADVAGFAPVVGELADAAASQPPAHLREAVMARLAATQQESTTDTNDRPAAPVVSLGDRRRRRMSIANMLTAAAAAVLLVVGAFVIGGRGGGTDFDDVLAASDAVVTQLEGEGGTFEVAYSAELGRVALRGENVDALQPGMRYALWAIAGETAIPAGLYEPDDGTIEDVVELADVGAEAWGITIEPDTGSDTPTPPIIFLGEV